MTQKFAFASLVLGIISIVIPMFIGVSILFSFSSSLPAFIVSISFISGIVSIILGSIALYKKQGKKIYAILGIIMSCIGIVLPTILIILALLYIIIGLGTLYP